MDSLESIAATPAAKTAYIQNAIRAASVELRKDYPILQRQSAIGAGILCFALLGMTVSAVLYINQVIPWWVCVLANAFFASLTHELEHDLIHYLYFRKNRIAHNLMLGLAWLARPTTINPWVRRQHHFNHHKFSGTEADLEERTLSNGTPWGVLRFFMICDLMLSTSVMIAREAGWKNKVRLLLTGAKAYVPLTVLSWSTWYVFLVFHTADYFNGAPGFYAETHGLSAWVAVMNTLVVVLIAPNVLRSFCLHFITSNIHYYGDVDPKNVITQTQVLNNPWFWPLQLFCANFGSTHGIHHFVVGEPFYVRQITARHAHQAMREMGVRFNDVASFFRANRWGVVETP
ncbi:Fatty acid desaturase [Pseudomonas syringae]|nr:MULTISPECIES: fatty acid desaturase [Pseudomonas syringae group]RMN41497.1 hypothetical protein ALQ59_200045 [Pseudomonas syringae pv. apii]SDZ37265.1 Fatty acid desaturase [Pseudomonas syringae]